MRILFTFLLVLFSTFSLGQQLDKLKLFVDCDNCDLDYIKSEIQIIDFVIDRLAADIHLLVTSTNNRNGGANYQMVYYGQRRFKGKTDKVLFTIPANATASESRAEVTKRIKLGLVPFIIHTPYSALIKIDMKLPDTTSKKVIIPPIHTKDRWDYWVFRVAADGIYSTDQVYNTSQISGTISADRITEQEKLHVELFSSYNNYTYKYEDSGRTFKYKVVNSNYYVDHSLVNSIENNWSLGYQINYSNSTFSNNKGSLFFAGGLEYALIPYKEVNTKSLTMSYNLTITHNRYYDTTIYNRVSELLPGHRVQLRAHARQKWGSVNGGISFSQFIDNFKLYNLSANVSLDLRITGGLFFYTFFNGALVHDQINLAKKGATEQEILSRQRQLASSYDFYSGAGLSFRFGSALNNIVNPRFATFNGRR
jgi:hypothetical protein